MFTQSEDTNYLDCYRFINIEWRSNLWRKIRKKRKQTKTINIKNYTGKLACSMRHLAQHFWFHTILKWRMFRCFVPSFGLWFTSKVWELRTLINGPRRIIVRTYGTSSMLSKHIKMKALTKTISIPERWISMFIN